MKYTRKINNKQKKGGALNNNNFIITPFEPNNTKSDIEENEIRNKKEKQILKKLKYTKKSKSALIGQGTYGCVYKPPLKCKYPDSCPEYNNKCSSGISKLMGYRNDVDEELKMYSETEIDKINSNGLYHIKEPRRCVPNENNVAKAKNDGCKIALKEPELLIYENGGMDLEKAIEKGTSPLSILFNFANIFKAVITLYSNDIGHCDIKLPNIVIGTNPSNPQYRLIDLGLTRKFSKSLDKNNKIFLQTYFAWAPDSIFLNNENFSESDIYKHINKFMKETGIIDDYYKSRGWWDRDFLVQMMKLSNLSPDNSLMKNRKQQYSLLTRSFDIYSIGACINDMIKMFSKFISNSSKYYIEDEEYQKEAKIAISLLSNYLNQSDILHPSAIFRPSPELAYQLYKNYVIYQIK
jgi:serine/threonine protein kinase